ncbi:MAG TPA: CBS domain-containing protein [Aquifex aeolicus]|nr:CBS domain-containing protein [Aquifex aeolicus]
MSVNELKQIFSELRIYEYLTVLKGGKPIGVVFKKDVEGITKKDLIVGDLTRLAVKIRDFNLERDGLIGIIELLPIIKEPIIVTDKKGKYIGVLTYDVLLHYITKYREYIIPLIQHIRKSLGKELYLYIFGIKNLKGFKEKFGYEKTKGLIKILYEEIQESFSGEIEEIAETEEIWMLSREPPEKEKVKALFGEFFKEYAVLFADYPKASLYGISINLRYVDSQENLYKKIKELRERAKKISGYIFVVHGIQPKLILYDPRKKKLLKNIKEKILSDFLEIVEELVNSPKDIWEFVLYDMFKKYPYFELFYLISSSGLQISNNIVNPNVNYFIVQGKKGADRSKRPYFKETMEKGEYISDIYLSKATDDFCITVAKRFEHNGKLYILAGDINFKEIHRLIKENTATEKVS